MDLNSGRTGLPVTTPRSPKYDCVRVSVTAAKSTHLPSARLASPGIAFCSMMMRGYAPRIAALSIGKDAYPPTPITASGLYSRRICRALKTAATIRPRFRTCRAAPTPLMPPTGNVCKLNPSFGTILASIPCSAPTNNIEEAGSRRSISRATAMPGNRCPPVPPPAMITFMSPKSGPN